MAEPATSQATDPENNKSPEPLAIKSEPVEDLARDSSPGPKEEPPFQDSDGEATSESKSPPPAAEPAQVHPLEAEWTLWYDSRMNPSRRMPGEQENYESNLQRIGTFGTVEDFWRLFNNVRKPGSLEVNANLHLFKKDIKPMWEDPINEKGGKWTLTLKPTEKSSLDQYWESLVLAMVGETLDPGDEVCGAVISRRTKQDRIALWNKNAGDRSLVITLGKKMKEMLAVPEKLKIEYSLHMDALKSGASYSNNAKLEI